MGQLNRDNKDVKQNAGTQTYGRDIKNPQPNQQDQKLKSSSVEDEDQEDDMNDIEDVEDTSEEDLQKPSKFSSKH